MNDARLPFLADAGRAASAARQGRAGFVAAAALLVLAGTGFLATAARADILIGIAGPMSGPFEIFGKEMKAGAEQAIRDINASGGILGQNLVLEVGDDRCDPKEAVAVANQMTGRGIRLMAGHFCSSASIPAAPVYAEAKIVQITPASGNPKLTETRAGPGVFRLAARDDHQGDVAGVHPRDEIQGRQGRHRRRPQRLRQGPRRPRPQRHERSRKTRDARRHLRPEREAISSRWSRS